MEGCPASSVGGFLWCPRCRAFVAAARFLWNEDVRPGWRGDYREAHCRRCRVRYYEAGHVYALLYQGEVEYVGSIEGPAEIRRDWHWHAAYTYPEAQQPLPLYRRLRTTDWNDWEFRVLQRVPWQEQTAYEMAWCHVLAPEGRLMPPLNVALPRKGNDHDAHSGEEGKGRRHMYRYDFERDRVVMHFDEPRFWPGDDWDAEDIKAHFQGLLELPPKPSKRLLQLLRGSVPQCPGVRHQRARPLDLTTSPVPPRPPGGATLTHPGPGFDARRTKRGARVVNNNRRMTDGGV
jgi:hypothetical protein